MATLVPALVQDQNIDSRNKGGVTGGKSNSLKAHQKNGGPVRKALADINTNLVRQSTTALSSKVNISKENPAKVGVKRVIKSGLLQDIKIPEDFIEEEIEKVHFTGTDAYILQEKMRMDAVEKEVQEIMSQFKPDIPWPDMPLYGVRLTKVDFPMKDHLDYEHEPELAKIDDSSDYLDESIFFDYPSQTFALSDDHLDFKIKEGT